jgi:hypothetical protein
MASVVVGVVPHVNETASRGSLLGATGMLWMTCVLLYGIWKLVFNVIFPAIEKARTK